MNAFKMSCLVSLFCLGLAVSPVSAQRLLSPIPGSTLTGTAVTFEFLDDSDVVTWKKYCLSEGSDNQR
jgi:hypothetical protein